MLKSIYRKILEDFAFISDYGYCFERKSKSHSAQWVWFKSERAELDIEYDKDRLNITHYISPDFFKSENLLKEYRKKRLSDEGECNERSILKLTEREKIDVLKDAKMVGHSYEEQVEQVKEILLEYLKKDENSLMVAELNSMKENITTEPIIIKYHKKTYYFSHEKIIVKNRNKVIWEIYQKDIEKVTYNFEYGLKNYRRFLSLEAIGGERAVYDYNILYLFPKSEKKVYIILPRDDFNTIRHVFKVPIKLF